VKRLGACMSKTTEKIEQELLQHLPQKDWIHFGAAMVLHGRYVCTAVEPKCPECVLNKLCPKIGVAPKKAKKQMASKTSKKAGTKKSQAQPGPDLFTSANVSGEDEAELHSAAAKHLRDLVPPDWHKILADEFTKPYFAELAEFVAEERKK